MSDDSFVVTIPPHLGRALAVMSRDTAVAPEQLVTQAVFAWLRINGYVLPRGMEAQASVTASHEVSAPAPAVVPRPEAPADDAAASEVAAADEDSGAVEDADEPADSHDAVGSHAAVDSDDGADPDRAADSGDVADSAADSDGPAVDSDDAAEDSDDDAADSDDAAEGSADADDAPARFAAAVARIGEIEDDLARLTRPRPAFARSADADADDEADEEPSAPSGAALDVGDDVAEEAEEAEARADAGPFDEDERTSAEGHPGASDDDAPPAEADVGSEGDGAVLDEVPTGPGADDGDTHVRAVEASEVTDDERLPPPVDFGEEGGAGVALGEDAEREDSDGVTLAADGPAQEEPGAGEGTFVGMSIPVALYIERDGEEPVRVDAEQFVIGRAPTCDLIIDSPRVSREHARITRRGIGFVLEDLGSSNGTWLGEARIQQRELESGDELRLGNEVLRFTVRAD